MPRLEDKEETARIEAEKSQQSSGIRYLTAEEIRETGLLQELNRTVLHPLGLALEVELPAGTIRIRDWRKDPEGVVFASEDLRRDGMEKHRRFAALWQQRVRARAKALGFIVQPPCGCDLYEGCEICGKYQGPQFGPDLARKSVGVTVK